MSLKGRPWEGGLFCLGEMDLLILIRQRADPEAIRLPELASEEVGDILPSERHDVATAAVAGDSG
jgi:hypothetical protein